MQPIPIESIKAIRLTCHACGVALTLPLDVREVPCRCFNCGQGFPSDNIKKLLLELHYAKQDLLQPSARHGFALEAVLD